MSPSVLIDKFGSFWPDSVEVRMAKGKASRITLSAEERRALESLARRRSTGQALALRSRIVLAAAEGIHNGLIAERLGIFRGTVGKWRERFARDRLDGLYDEPRPGAPRPRDARVRQWLTDQHGKPVAAAARSNVAGVPPGATGSLPGRDALLRKPAFRPLARWRRAGHPRRHDATDP